MARASLALLALLTVVASIPASGAEPGPALFGCQRSIAGASTRWVQARHGALVRCFTKALRCPDVLGGDATAATDACLARVGAGCSRLLTKAGRAALAVDGAGLACTLGGRRRIAPEDLLGDEGVGLALLAPFCPETQVHDGDAESASRCQRLALTCAVDASVALSMPRAGELMARFGIPSGVGARCLISSLCGNAILDGDEECDAGPGNSDTTPDACRTTCLEPDCGDGVVDEDEDCDDGNHLNGDGCDEDCFLEEGSYCGDGVVDVIDDEECDDGNHVNGDGCDEDCFVEPATSCGDGVVDDDEECDDGPLNSDVLPDRCRTDCSAPWCGDGVVDLAEDELCEPPGTLLCDDDCLPRLLPLGLRAAPAEPAGCQLAITVAARRTFQASRGGTARCVARLSRCVFGIDEARDPDGDRFDVCVERADRRCAAIAAKLDRVRSAAAATATQACEAVPLQTMLDEAGLGFVSIADECPVPPGTAPTGADVVGCALAHARCEAERTVADAVPRGFELLEELFEVDAEEAFPCVQDPDDLQD